MAAFDRENIYSLHWKSVSDHDFTKFGIIPSASFSSTVGPESDGRSLQGELVLYAD